MNMLVPLVFAAAAATALPAIGQVTLYEHDDFRGRSLRLDGSVTNLERRGFNDVASSVVVRGSHWEICEDARYEGRCIVLQPGRYPSLGRMDLNDRISSVRRAEGYGANTRDRRRERAYSTPAPPNSEYSQQ